MNRRRRPTRSMGIMMFKACSLEHFPLAHFAGLHHCRFVSEGVVSCRRFHSGGRVQVGCGVVLRITDLVLDQIGYVFGFLVAGQNVVYCSEQGELLLLTLLLQESIHFMRCTRAL